MAEMHRSACVLLLLFTIATAVSTDSTTRNSLTKLLHTTTPHPTEITCDCFFAYAVRRTVYKDDVKIQQLKNPNNVDLRKTMLAWSCSTEMTCKIDVNDRNNEHRKQFFGDTNLPSGAVPVCMKHEFYEKQKIVGSLYSCGIDHVGPAELPKQKALCSAKTEGANYCVYHLLGKFTDKEGETDPPETQTTKSWSGVSQQTGSPATTASKSRKPTTKGDDMTATTSPADCSATDCSTTPDPDNGCSILSSGLLLILVAATLAAWLS